MGSGDEREDAELVLVDGANVLARAASGARPYLLCGLATPAEARELGAAVLGDGVAAARRLASGPGRALALPGATLLSRTDGARPLLAEYAAPGGMPPWEALARLLAALPVASGAGTGADPVPDVLLREGDAAPGRRESGEAAGPPLHVQRRQPGGWATVAVAEPAAAAAAWRDGARADTLLHLGPRDPDLPADLLRLPWPGILATEAAARALGPGATVEPAGRAGLFRLVDWLDGDAPRREDAVCGAWPCDCPDPRVGEIGLPGRLAARLAGGGLATASGLCGAACGDLFALGLDGRDVDRVRGALERARKACERSRGRQARARARDTEGPLLDRDYPEWFLATPLDDLGLTPAVRRALSPAGTVGGTRDVTVASCLAEPGFGMSKVLAFRAAVAEVHRRAVEAGAGAGDLLSVPLLPFLERSVAFLPSRDGAVLAARLGLRGAPETLEQVGDRHGVTRERVRQIEARAVRRMRGDGGWAATVARRLEGIPLDEPLAFRDLAAEPWAQGMPPHSLARLADLLSPAGLCLVEHPAAERCANGPVLSPVASGRVAAAGAALVEVARSVPPTSPYGDAIGRALADLPGLSLADAAFLRALFRPADEDGWIGRLLARGEGTRARVVRLVHDSPVPVTFAEVLSAVGEAIDREVAPARLRLVLLEEHLFLPDGRVGGRGLLPPPRRVGRIEAACAAAMGTAPRRWTTEGVAAAVAAAEPELLEGLVPGVLDMILRDSPRFDDLGRGKWAPAGTMRGRPPTFMEAVEAVLERAGGPLRPRDVQAAVREAYGETRFAQMREGGRVLRVRDGWWGLYGRDLILDARQEEELGRVVGEALSQGPAGASALLAALREAGAAPDGLDEGALCSLIKLRGLGAADMRGTVHPPAAAMPAPREGSVADDVMALLREAGGPLSAREVENAIQRRRGNVSGATVRQALRRHAERVELPEGPRWAVRGQAAT